MRRAQIIMRTVQTNPQIRAAVHARLAATRLAVSRQTVNAVETGRYEPSLSLAFAIAAPFAMPIEGIFQAQRQAQRFTGIAR